MVMAALNSNGQSTVYEVADATIRCLLQSVPAAVAGVAFLSGGQPGELATAHLNAMKVQFKSKLPWPITFSFARAIQQPAMDIWQGNEANIKAAQHALYHRAKFNHAAVAGKYSHAMELT
jgi:fructose-bisphosphate aldolase class I